MEQKFERVSKLSTANSERISKLEVGKKITGNTINIQPVITKSQEVFILKYYFYINPFKSQIIVPTVYVKILLLLSFYLNSQVRR